MARVHVDAKGDFLESLATVKPLMAVAELIWNGFDAGANNVHVLIDRNKLNEFETIRIRDDGEGMPYTNVNDYFGNLGNSWKKYTARKFERALHGKSGKGRFKAFALGEKVEWHTCFQDNQNIYSYRITGHSNSLEEFEVSDPTLTHESNLGTEVAIYNLKRDFASLQADSAAGHLARIFAPYLTEYPKLGIEFDGISVDPGTARSYLQEYQLPDINLGNGKRTNAVVSIIEWNIPTDRALHLCDQNGISLHELSVGPQVRAPGYNFTIYVKSGHVLELDKANQLHFEELNPEVKAIVDAAKEKAKDHFRKRIAESQSKIVERWKKEDIYPYADKGTRDPIEIVEMQVFDILAVNVQSYLPAFEESTLKSKKFTFRLLAQAIRQNPESVQEIIGEVLGLKKEEQDELAQLLRKTSLSSIISSAKIVANRLDFLNGLENLLFDKENKKALLERDQLHKILENEAWLFGQDFALAGSEIRLDEVLQKHIELLGQRTDNFDSDDVSKGNGGRVDLMLHKIIQPRTGEYDYLVVELKRPSQKINSDVLTQIEKYALAVASDERMHGIPARWKFVAVSNEFDHFAEKKANQRGQPKGKIYDDADRNITVWAHSWSEIINDARARLRFFNEQLAYGADNDSAVEYLKKTHAKYIPEMEKEDVNKADSNQEP